MSLLCLTKEVAFYPTDNEKPTRTFKQESCQIRLGQLCVYRATLTCIWRMGWRPRKQKQGGQGQGVARAQGGIEGAAGQEAKDSQNEELAELGD